MPFIATRYAQQVLGYSALEFDAGFVAIPVAAAAGMIVAQAAVAGFRPVAAAGMALLGAGAHLLTRASVGGSYFGDVFFGEPSRFHDFVAANDGADPLVVPTEGFQSAFVACVVLAAVGMALALLLLAPPRTAPDAGMEPVPATAPAE